MTNLIKRNIHYLVLISMFSLLFFSCSGQEEVQVDQNTALVFRGDSHSRLVNALLNSKIDLTSKKYCENVFNGCCLPRPVSSYNEGLYLSLYNIASPLANDIDCQIWLNYKSDDGQILAFPVQYKSDVNEMKVNGVYSECIKEESRFWVPNFHYFHNGWRSETFDYVMDFAPTKLVRFKQQFCRLLPIQTDMVTKYKKIFPLEISESREFQTYAEEPFEDIVVEYKDVVEGINNFADYYYFDRLDYLKDRFANVAFLIRDNQSHFPVEGAQVRITPLSEDGPSKELQERFSDFSLRAASFDYGLFGFRECAGDKYLHKISMQNRLSTYFEEYGYNPWAIIQGPLTDFTDRKGEIYWTKEFMIKEKVNNYIDLLKTQLFKQNISPKSFFYVMETNKKYRISIIHPRYMYFEREVIIDRDSQIIIDLDQTRTKVDVVKDGVGPENMFIRPINLR